METLATNPEKAALVRFLTIALGYSRDKMIDENIRRDLSVEKPEQYALSL